MKLAVVGSRNWKDQQAVYGAIRDLAPELVISGGAIGVDCIARMAADYHNIPTLIFKPEWAKYGKRAGAIRNQQIVDACDQLIAFWDGESPGTKISIDMAQRAGKLLKVVGVNLGVKKDSQTEG